MPEEPNKHDEPIKIPLDFDEAVEGLLGVKKPKKKLSADELRKKSLARKKTSRKKK